MRYTPIVPIKRLATGATAITDIAARIDEVSSHARSGDLRERRHVELGFRFGGPGA